MYLSLEGLAPLVAGGAPMIGVNPLVLAALYNSSKSVIASFAMSSICLSKSLSLPENLSILFSTLFLTNNNFFSFWSRFLDLAKELNFSVAIFLR